MKRLLLFALLVFAVSCEKKDGDGIDWNDGKIRDGDGNVYTEITASGQTWLRENLRTSKLNDRTTKIQQQVSGGNAGIFYNDIYHDERGYIYSLDAALLPNLCPEGYRVPTKDDFLSTPKKDLFPQFGDWWSTTLETRNGKRGGYCLGFQYVSHGFYIYWHDDTEQHQIRCIKKTEVNE